VLGQWFEDGGPGETYVGPGTVPAFFANLEPEGPLARWLVQKNQLGDGPLELLGTVGDDLPGAVRLVRSGPIARSPRSIVQPVPRPTPAFSVAGVQLKLPMSLERDDRLTIPMAGELSDHLLKVPTAGRWRGLTQNEAATMNWARRAGFSVAACEVRSVLPAHELIPADGEPCLLVRRFDRTLDGPVHQEDLAQAQWLDPEQKYPREHGDPRFDAASEGRRRGLATVEGIGRYARALLGPAGFEEFLRRFLFVVASGNGDAHLKNWSLWYPDRLHPGWAPLYDQVSTIAWHDATMACPLYGTRNFAALHLELVRRLADDNAYDRAEALVAATWARCGKPGATRRARSRTPPITARASSTTGRPSRSCAPTARSSDAPRWTTCCTIWSTARGSPRPTPRRGPSSTRSWRVRSGPTGPRWAWSTTAPDRSRREHTPGPGSCSASCPAAPPSSGSGAVLAERHTTADDRSSGRRSRSRGPRCSGTGPRTRCCGVANLPT
jgi:serine/threonine-protein kinase HipA